MKILALDCSTTACSVALLSQGEKSDTSTDMEVVQRFEMAARQHTQRLLPMVESLLAEHETPLSQLDAIGFSRGPGSFTGLRICIGAVQGLAFGADLPVVPISTLAAQAKAYLQSDESAANSSQASMQILSTLDARMDEVYWGVYQASGNGVELIGKERLTAPECLSIDPGTMKGTESTHYQAIVGSGLAYAARIPSVDQYTKQLSNISPTAEAVALLSHIEFENGNYCQANQALPVYLRDEVAWQKQAPAS